MLTQKDGKGNITTYEYNAGNKVLRCINHGGRGGTGVVIASMGKGHFTKGGHFIVLSGVSEVNEVNMITVLDPNDNNGNWGNDGTIIRTDEPGIVLADSNVVDKEHKEYFIIKIK